jgi:hypothetical protein
MSGAIHVFNYTFSRNDRTTPHAIKDRCVRYLRTLFPQWPQRCEQQQHQHSLSRYKLLSESSEPQHLDPRKTIFKNTCAPSSPSSISLPNRISHPITCLNTDRQWLRFDLLEAGTSTPTNRFPRTCFPAFSTIPPRPCFYVPRTSWRWTVTAPLANGAGTAGNRQDGCLQ